MGLLLDGHRVRARENQPRGRHTPSYVVAGWTGYVVLVQGDTSGCSPYLVDIKEKVAFYIV